MTDPKPDTPPRGDWRIVGALLPYLWQFRWRIGLALAFMLLAKLANVAVPLVLARLVDGLDVDPSLLVLPVALLLAYGAARLSTTVFTELRQVVFARVTARVARLVTLQVFQHLHALSLRFHLQRRTGGVARDVERGSGAISDLLEWTIYTILPTLVEVALVTTVLVVSFGVDFALITGATLVAYIGFTFFVTEWRTRYYREMVEANTRANERAVDSLLNYETVKYFNNEEHEARLYDHNLREVEAAQVQSLKSLAVLNTGQSAIVAVGVTAMMWRAATGVVDGAMSIGDLVAVNAYLLQLSAPLFLLGMMYREIRQALTNLERLFGLLGENEEVRDTGQARVLAASRPELRFEDVDFGYEGNRQILHGVDFTVAPGQTVAVVGHSGSGKSTLSRLLYRFYDVGAGRISIDGVDIRELSQDSLRRAIAIVPQDTVLFNDSIHYNILYGRPDASPEEVIDAARSAHIHDFIVSLPEGYDSPVGERGLKLSGGEKQRVAIARALLKNPAILIFDEATSALDSKSEKAIQAELDRIARGRTTLVIAHRLSTVMDADEILVLEGGHIVERGTHAALLAMEGHYAAMWRLQQQQRSVAASDAEGVVASGSVAAGTEAAGVVAAGSVAAAADAAGSIAGSRERDGAAIESVEGTARAEPSDGGASASG